MIRISLNEIKVYIHKHSKEVNNQNVLEKLYEIANYSENARMITWKGILVTQTHYKCCISWHGYCE